MAANGASIIAATRAAFTGNLLGPSGTRAHSFQRPTPRRYSNPEGNQHIIEGEEADVTEFAPEWLCRRIVEATGDAVIFGDREGRIRFWNAGAEATFGYSAAEALGRSMDIIIPERLRGRHWEGWHKVMSTGTTRYGKDLLAVPAARKDGTGLSIEFTIQMIRDEAGQLVGAAAVVRDVTARFGRDKEMRARLKELEAQLERKP
jgi:PAS domain S-box-containing protein